jgi:hypothetical protein
MFNFACQLFAHLAKQKMDLHPILRLGDYCPAVLPSCNSMYACPQKTVMAMSP